MRPCIHKWKEDELFACGAMLMVCGSLNEMSQETRLLCTKCGEVAYVATGEKFSLKDIINSNPNMPTKKKVEAKKAKVVKAKAARKPVSKKGVPAKKK